MKIEITKRPVMVKFINIDGIEFVLNDLYGTINQLMEYTNENDRYGDYSLRDYELYDYETADKLVKLGYIKNYIGSRMANLYCIADKTKIKELLDKIDEIDIE